MARNEESAGRAYQTHEKRTEGDAGAEEAELEKLRAVGAKRGLGYQTMLKLILREKVDEYA